jgi:hypothetical protein
MKLTLTKDLTAPKAEAVAKINAAALRRRNAIVPPGAAYEQKKAEAVAVRSGDTAGLLILPAESALRGVSLADLAAAVLDKAAQAPVALAEIEIERQRKLAAIAAANSPAEIEAALSV